VYNIHANAQIVSQDKKNPILCTHKDGTVY